MMRTKILILGLICLFIFPFCKSPADPEIEKALIPNVVMTYGPKGIYIFEKENRPQDRFRVEGGVKNIGNKIAFNTKVKVKTWSYGGTLLFSGETVVGDGKLEPQQYVEWYIIFTEGVTYDIIEIRNMLRDEKYEIKYEITWE